ncbi:MULTISPECIES: hypothetical protein [Streptomyces]|uniref:hypothetical protein n=1 Tax=Streptomyces TaxID=1883 RepID=UPI0021A285AE|nr:hypothetical protein [Streptomyces atratus]MCT2548985.1 hypothetical protein [Streptomyces atratus]
MTYRKAGQGGGRELMKATLRWAVCACLVATGVTACDDGGAGTEEPDVLSASQVCDGTLTSAGAAALERIGGKGGYTELENSERWSLKSAAKGLQEAATSRYECDLYPEGDKSGHPLMTIGFIARKTHPDPVKAAKEKEHDQLFYPLGVYASSTGYLATSLFFECPTKRAEGGTSYVKAEMYSAKNKMNADSTGKDRMTILNDMSRALAEELGCAARAELPAKVPDATSD